MKTVMCFGTFDVLHPGHRSYFQQAKQHGERLVVVVARDSNVARIKGTLPLQGEQTRLEAVSAAPEVDTAVLGNEGGNFYAVIERYSPDIIALGYDQTADSAALQQRFPAVTILRLRAFKPERYKSSLLNSHNHASSSVPASRY